MQKFIFNQLYSLDYSKNFIFTIFPCLFFCSACNVLNDKHISTATDTLSNPEKQEYIVKPIYNRRDSLCFFSSDKTKDRFMIELKGDSILGSVVYFSIISAEKDTLYATNFPARAFIGYGLVEYQNPTTKQKEDYISKRFNHFFDSTHFSKPIVIVDEYDSMYNSMISKTTWKGLKSKKNLIGFTYIIWEESIISITYSESEKKVIVYQVCC